MDKETEFFSEKMELDCGNKQVLEKLKILAQDIDWLKGWPEDRTAFWNGEALLWNSKISQSKRTMIEEELSSLKQDNLDLGCGGFSYFPSVGVDISEKMLLQNTNLTKKIVADLEEKLPFEDASFASVTLVFVLNYIKNYQSLLQEAKRVLKEQGTMIVVQPIKPVNHWQRQQAINEFKKEQLEELLISIGFNVSINQKENIFFFRCEKVFK